MTDEQRRIATQRLADALGLLSDGSVAASEGVHEELRHAEVFCGVQGLAMDIGVIAFREESRLVRHKIAYTIDWLLQRDATEIARQIDEDIRDRLVAA